MKSFESLGLSEETLQALKKKGFEEPTPIQSQTIPVILQGTKDVLGQAQTGTGKTGAFGLPMIELLKEMAGYVQALVLAPTRELAIQVAEEINSLKGSKKLSIVAIYGGQAISQQFRSLKKGVDIVVGTPGRIIDHINRGSLKLDKIFFLVLDEADEMLNMGFIDDVREIMATTNAEKRTMLFSATMPKEIMQIAKKYMKDHEIFRVDSKELTSAQTDQIYFEVSNANKFEALCRIIDMEEDFYALIFCRTRLSVGEVSRKLMERGYDADALSGEMSQNAREQILDRFKKRRINILVATDVAARGIDVQDLTHVINYCLPQDSQSYVHRIGRTGRAGKTGNAITFITPSEYRRLQVIGREAKTEIRKAKLPNVRDVIEMKKNRIKSEIEEIVKNELHRDYFTMAEDMLKNNNSQDLLAAFLQYTFQDTLDEKKYTEIETSVIDSQGKTRLFVTHGKNEGLTPKKLISLIIEKCDIDSRQINDIKILDRFSFLTLPFREAELLLSFFKKNDRRGSGLFITKAKQRQ